MKYDKLWLPVTAVLALVLAFMPEGDILTMLALPYTALGWLLRTLSLSGGPGNAASLALFALVSLLPLVLWRKLRWNREDWLLAVLVPVQAFTLYLMVNPGLRPEVLQNDVGDVIYAGAVWSVLVTWGVGKLLRHTETVNLYRALECFLRLCGAVCIVAGWGTGVAELRTQVADPVALLAFGTGAAEQTLLALVFWHGAKLMAELGQDPYSDRCVAAGEQVSLWCRRTVKAAVVMDLCLNLGQILLAGVLTNVEISVRIPVFSLAVSFGMMALTRLLVQGKVLKDDNDLFI